MQNPHDIDPTETAEWAEAFINSITANGEERGKHLLDMLIRTAHQQQIGWSPELVTPLVNTITVAKQGVFPGDLAIEEKIASLMRWNALAMVAKANTAYGELGGHIASYASAADLFEVGFNHFYHGRTSEHNGDLVFFQPHSAPGVYARAYLEGRLTEQDLSHYRQEITAAEIGVQGLSSYPHPWLMPNFWQFPTGSMGIGPISSIYQARFMRYLSHRNLLDCSQRRVWGVFGDGEMDEPESMSALTLASREKLDNLTWVVNCNLQRLDGPVRSNGRIIDELEKLFRGAGWNVIKLVWGSDWDGLFARDHSGSLVRKHTGQPTVILAHKKKGYGMGHAAQGKMTTHSQKKFDEEALIGFRNRFNLPLSDAQAINLDFYRPSEDSKEMQYLQQRRAELGGYLPKRIIDCERLSIPPLESYAGFALAPDDKSMSTTMAFVRLLGNLLKTPELGARIVPIVADEARTFGMANLFKQVGIYSSVGQCYEPEDIGSVLSYREALNGQILEEGISEAGAIASWTAAATSYANHGFAMLPFYIYYSIFGFQRVGDAIWAAADQRARGFLLGATSGRTTLGGEGLQHQDGSSHLVAATIPNCKAYDPAFAGELAVIIDAGMREMLTDQRDVFYYITLMNENYAQTNLLPGKEKDILAGGYHYQKASPNAKQRVTLLGSGAILLEVTKAAELLKQVGIDADIFSITSWSELARNGQQKLLAVFADNDGGDGVDKGLTEDQAAFITSLLANSAGPIIAATDYVRAVPESIRAYMPSQRNYFTLGTDGFGRSDTRAALREFFQVDAASIAKAAQFCLHSGAKINSSAGFL